MGVGIPKKRAGYLNHNYGYVDGNPINRFDPTGEADPLTIALVLWGIGYLTHAGDYISDENGIVWGVFSPQDGTCSLGPLSGLGDSCFPERCENHDACYTESQCNSSSWASSVLGGTKSCNQCNSGFF
jgi:hypothetical protein